MRIGNETKKRWERIASIRGMKTKCHNKTGLSRATIDKALSNGDMHFLVFEKLSKFFNKQKV